MIPVVNVRLACLTSLARARVSRCALLRMLPSRHSNVVPTSISGDHTTLIHISNSRG
jgi:hypothetical protein